VTLCCFIQLPFDAGRISKMGENKIIWIAEGFHDNVEPFGNKQLRIQIDDEM
jgi:hypothetical protein